MARHAIPDLLPGTLDMLILRTLQTGSMHGWAISERIQQISRDVLQINQGSLYPALYRLEGAELLASRWTTVGGRRRRVYRLTRRGRARLARERKEWRAFAGAMEAVTA